MRRSGQRGQGTNEELVKLIDGMIDLNKDEEFTTMSTIRQAMSEGRLEEAKRLMDEAERRYGYNDVMSRYQVLEYEGKFEEALALCDKSLASEPQLHMLERKAEVLREMDRIQEQLGLFDQWDAHFHDDSQFLAA